jgi:hypothetical protein
MNYKISNAEWKESDPYPINEKWLKSKKKYKKLKIEVKIKN